MIRQQIGKRIEPEGSIGIKKANRIVLYALHDGTESEGIDSTRQKNVISRLERVPVKRLTAYQSARVRSNRRVRHARDTRHGGNQPGELAGNETIRGILNQRIENLGDSAINADRAIESKASRVQKPRAEHGLFMEGESVK